MKVEGYISRKSIIRWLEDYEYMQAGDQSPDAPPVNSGPKNYDGISGGRLNKIMLDSAIARLSPLKRSCLEAKYIERLPREVTMRALEISEKVYRSRVEAAIDDIYNYLNGEKAHKVKIPGNIRNFFSKIDPKA